MYPITFHNITPTMFHALTLEIKAQLGYFTSNTHGMYCPSGWEVAWTYDDRVQRLNVFVKHPSDVTVDQLKEWEEKLSRAAWGDFIPYTCELPVVIGDWEYLKYFHCPGCDGVHTFNPTEFFWNGSTRVPTLRPCLKFTRCHVYVENGRLRFLDCGHKLNGQIVDMLPI